MKRKPSSKRAPTNSSAASNTPTNRRPRSKAGSRQPITNTEALLQNAKEEIQNILKQKDDLHTVMRLSNGINEAMGLPIGPANLGVELSQANTFFRNLRFYNISNLRQLLSQMYVELGVIQTVVNVPVDDAFRGGVIIKSKQLDEDEVQELGVVMEQKADLQTYAHGEYWNRLFGGGGIITITGDDPMSPLEIESIKKDDKLAFRAVDLWELYGDRQNLDNGEGNLEDVHSEFYDYYGHKLHKSRVHILKGLEAPSFVRPRLRGWGLSIVEALVRSVNQYLKSQDLTFEVLDEFKVDYFKMKGLVNSLLSPTGEQSIRRRIQCANQQKNYQHAVVMDSEDDWMQKELSFTGLAETMAGIRMQIASDLRMPLTKVFGISAAGFSSGEDDIENYNAMVESTVRAKAKFGIINMLKLRCQQTFGYYPDDLTIEFKPLRILGAEQEENVKTQKHARLMTTWQAGGMSTKEFKDACNRDNLLGIQLDTSIDKLDTFSETEPENPDQGFEKKGPKSTLSAPKAKNSLGLEQRLSSDAFGVTDDDLSEYYRLDTHEMNALNNDYKLMNPGDVDESLWSKAKQAAEKESGATDKWALTTYLYKKMVGHFTKKG